jgi:hypothetical protein
MYLPSSSFAQDFPFLSSSFCSRFPISVFFLLLKISQSLILVLGDPRAANEMPKIPETILPTLPYYKVTANTKGRKDGSDF